jgi:hypothetical protein
MDEYLERMGLASEAVTYGDLAPLSAASRLGPPKITWSVIYT